ncbi:hypothetical protein GCM10023201_53290 [Actinomycetospora corticicola]|uniref:Uncharacterized protein n=1 Tax=Actinomycetospora corticicola TaxID=663602 RepID=A0A7Y9J3W2_9PSEU|nr:hypothetical protein [Actinomycetospora corticicola]NYD34405.1 hypothetical protein [Actinomycetospora corticicola]
MVERRGDTPPAGEPLTVRMPPTGPTPTAANPPTSPTPTVATTATPATGPTPATTTSPAGPPTGPAPVVGKGPRWPLLALVGLLLLALGGAGGWLARGAVTPTAVATPAPAVTTTVAPTSTVPPAPVAGPPIVPVTSTRAQDGPALGRSQGDRRGYGAVQPAEIDGGTDRGLVTGITWEDWGEDRATGRGTALYRPGDEPDARGVQDRATVVAFDLGDCDGDEAYRRVTWYFPQHGEEFRESRAQELCD